MRLLDEAVVLGYRRFQDSLDIALVFSREHGLMRGVYRRDKRHAQPQPGSVVSACWTARLAEQLGRFELETTQPAPILLGNRLGLAALSSAVSLLHDLLPERHPYPVLYAALVNLIRALTANSHAAAAYLEFELILLQEAGYGLDVSRCAVTGTTEDLRYISPRTGRAVSSSAGAAYKDKLFPLLPTLKNPALAGNDWRTAGEALRILSAFLNALLHDEERRVMPAPRERLLDCISGDAPAPLAF
jgi:DNA repair protein RecO (recombination protein O)